MKRFSFLLFIVLAALVCAAGLYAADAPKAAPIKLDELAQTKLQALALQGQIKDLQAGKAQCEFTLAQVNRDQAAEAQKIVDDAARWAGLDPAFTKWIRTH